MKRSILSLITMMLAATLFMAACTGETSAFPTNPAVTATGTTIMTAPATLQSAASPHEPGCTVQIRQTTPNPTVESLLPPVTDEDWSIGPADALVTIVEYGDFQCPGCAGIEPILTQLKEKYSEDLRLAYRHYPLKIHDKAALAEQAAEAAGRQDKFWEMHDLLFGKRDEWLNLEADPFQDWLAKQAGELGLDVEQFKTDLNSQELVQKASADYERNAAIGMPGTPFLVINGSPYNGPLDAANLDATIALTVLQKRQYSVCPPLTTDPQKQYYAVLHTQKGDITLELFADKAPLAVNSFIFLAKQDWFDGVTFHRVLPDFVAQAGDPTGTGFGGPGYAFDNEIDPSLTFDGPGVLAMANAGANSNGSQFFITYAPTPTLNGGYTIFGRVSAGMDVVKLLTPRDPSKSMDLPAGDAILDVEIIEK